MKRTFMVLLYLNIFVYLNSQDNIKNFIEQILISYKSDSQINTTVAKETFFKNILKKSNIDFVDGNYIFIPQFDLVFKKLSTAEKKELKEHSNLEKYASIEGMIRDSINFAEIDRYIKNKYLTYLNTKKIYLSGMYIYKDSIFYGRIKENPYTYEFFYRNTEVKNETNWIKLFANIIIEKQPTLLFTVRDPYSPLFLLFTNNVKVMEYDPIKQQISLIDLEDYLHNNYFVFGEAFISDKRNVPIVSN